MSFREGGKFALGLVFGLLSTVFVLVYWPGCGDTRSTLWFCGESPDVVIATLEFISQLANSLSWPIGILLLGLMFHRKINTLLGSITRIKAPGIEAEFSALVEDAESNLADDNNIPESDRNEVPPHIMKYLEVDKKYAVIAAWLSIEKKLFRLAEVRHLLEGSSRPQIYFRDALFRKLEFPGGIVEAIRDLRNARNAVAHANADDMTESSVIKYLQIAAEIDGFLDGRILEQTDLAK